MSPTGMADDYLEAVIQETMACANFDTYLPRSEVLLEQTVEVEILSPDFPEDTDKVLWDRVLCGNYAVETVGENLFCYKWGSRSCSTWYMERTNTDELLEAFKQRLPEDKPPRVRQPFGANLRTWLAKRQR